MEVSLESKVKIEQAFASIGGMRAFTSFSRLSKDQTKCVETVKELRDKIMTTKGRDRYLGELITSITGASDEEDEAVNEATFSQYRFFQMYVHDFMYYPEKFDFLLRCVEERVVLVAQGKMFLGLIEKLLTSDRVETVPDHVVNYDELLKEDEVRRIESFTLRKDWKGQVVHYLEQ